jgi:lipopolysaccharide transport system ATP-binding protein
LSTEAIAVENLGKRYRLGERERYVTLRDVLARSLSAPLRAFHRAQVNPNGNGSPSHVWALRDVSFEVNQGETIGVIGRNGAGKSTLLKILARITQPSEGRARIRGRVGSLLEVGTGFHPELTGRENVFLSGAILGMKKAEIDKKFDEIAAFSGVEAFLDTPLKHYSSGMQMRLAFAVAAHLEPEVLLVDEVLAVGDLEFQKKCLGKMEEVTRGGRTVLFVSHNMGAVRRICTRGAWLDGGRLRMLASAGECVDAYSASVEQQVLESGGCFDLSTRSDRVGNGSIRFRSIKMRGADQQDRTCFEFGEPFSIVFDMDCMEDTRACFVGLPFLASDGTYVLSSHHSDSAEVVELRAGDHYQLLCRYDPNTLKPGGYILQAAILNTGTWEFIDWIYAIGPFTVSEGSGKFGRTSDHRPGYTHPVLEWSWQ